MNILVVDRTGTYSGGDGVDNDVVRGIFFCIAFRQSVQSPFGDEVGVCRTHLAVERGDVDDFSSFVAVVVNHVVCHLFADEIYRFQIGVHCFVVKGLSGLLVLYESGVVDEDV